MASRDGAEYVSGRGTWDVNLVEVVLAPSDDGPIAQETKAKVRPSSYGCVCGSWRRRRWAKGGIAKTDPNDRTVAEKAEGVRLASRKLNVARSCWWRREIQLTI